MATLEREYHPKERPLTSTVNTETISGNNLPENTYPELTQRKRGREERVQESAMIRNSKAFDPQRSADNTACVKQ